MSEEFSDNHRIANRVAPQSFSPSEFMRNFRPEYYSDTEERTSYSLNSSTLEYHLNTITPRNQTHEFEVFCRKLCERTICPNLRPQTGPDGGGDSKADTETYPVAEEISGLTYIGNPNSGRERWAFAFSAQRTWSQKVRDDVRGIAETGRVYDRIFFVTSRFARAKDRARIEDELANTYQIPVTIHDRSWIVNEIIEKNRIDLAFNYLGVGEAVNDAQRLGPTDYSRTQHLSEIERVIEDPTAFHGMESQRATEALVAANLSRGLERPRIETDGRFERAIRLANKHGTYRQILASQYEKIQTAFWWFDDFEFLINSYDEFESLALQSDHVMNLAFLCNLNQMLVNLVVHGQKTCEECRFDERTENLRQKLASVADDKDRPNNSLEAQAAVLRIEFNEALLANNTSDLSKIWKGYSMILNKANGLIEFDAEHLVSIIEVAGEAASDDPDYNDLVEQLADFVSKRKSEGEGALILLNRVQQLNFSNRYEMIRLLGRASIGLNKREYAQHLIEATQLLTLAYRNAGLLWAARATCIFAIASITVEGEEDSEIPASIVSMTTVWAWIALELGHLPDFLLAIQSMNGFVSSLPLTDESKSKVQSDIRELDTSLGCFFLNLDESDLRRLESVPDILQALRLPYARLSLLYSLGYENVLREDGSLPQEETDENVKQLLSTLKCQPMVDSFRGLLNLNNEGSQILATTILGMKVEVEIDGKDSILIAESILGALEAFFATTIQRDVIPHTESFRITVTRNDQVHEPIIETSELDMASVISWPCRLKVSQIEEQANLRKFLIEVALHIMSATCKIRNSLSLLKDLFTEEAVQHRIMIVIAAPNNYSRVVGRYFSRLSDWQELAQRSYSLRDNRTILPTTALSTKDKSSYKDPQIVRDEFEVHSHREMSVSSVIDVHAWDQAVWKGCCYAKCHHIEAPYMAFLFENAAVAKKIFERWRTRFGEADVEENIHVSIIRRLTETNPHDYCVQIGSMGPEFGKNKNILLTQVSTRSLTMNPENGENLDKFLVDYEKFGAYYLLPAIGTTNPQFYWNLAILKRRLTTKSAREVCEQDIESIALRIRGQFPVSS